MFEILVVDDDDFLLEMTCEKLSRKFNDCALTTASSGAEAIRKIQSGKKFDLIVCDYNMPGGKGTQVLKYLMGNNHKIYFILYTSQLLPDLPETNAYFDAYFIGVIEKRKFEDLFEAVSKCRAHIFTE